MEISILMWNAHWFNELVRVKEATNILVENKVGVFSLIMTKVKKINCSRITNCMREKWRWIDNYDSDDSGRIVVGWDPGLYKITKLKVTSQMIHAVAYNSQLDVTFCVTFIYASNNVMERHLLWDDLKVVSIGRKEGWIVLGDFNNVLYSYERIEGESVIYIEIEPFVECVAENGLTGPKARGCYYACVRRGDSRDRKCLKNDRAMVNMEWLSLLLDSTTNFLPQGCLTIVRFL